MTVRFLVDENLPPLLATRLASLGHDVKRVGGRQLGASDEDLLGIAHQQGRIVITRDKVIGARVFMGGAAVHGLILVRLPRATKEGLVEHVVDTVQSQADWNGWTSTILPRRVRRRRLPR